MGVVLRWTVVSSVAVVLSATAALALVRHETQPQAAGLPGELVYQRGNVTFRLQQGDCRHEDLVEALVIEGKETTHHSAVIQQGDRMWTACWAQDHDTDVLLVDVTGSRGFMPWQWFRKV